MTTLFWFALVVGGGLLLVSTVGHLLGELAGDAGAVDASADTDVEAELDADGAGADATHVDGAGHGDHESFRFLSLRTATYFLFGFGATGVLLTVAWGGQRSALTATAAVATGIIAAWLSAALFRWVGRGESGELASDRALVGATGVVTLPLPADGTGKVLVRAYGRELELLARPVDPAGALDPAEWTDVMVVDVADGVALVTPYEKSGG